MPEISDIIPSTLWNPRPNSPRPVSPTQLPAKDFPTQEHFPPLLQQATCRSTLTMHHRHRPTKTLGLSDYPILAEQP